MILREDGESVYNSAARFPVQPSTTRRAFQDGRHQARWGPVAAEDGDPGAVSVFPEAPEARRPSMKGDEQGGGCQEFKS